MTPVLFRDGEVVASADGGGWKLCPPYRDNELKRVELRNLRLTDRGHETLAGSNWYDALSELFEIEIRNADGTTARFTGCRADLAGLSGKPTDTPLDVVDFYTRDRVQG